MLRDQPFMRSDTFFGVFQTIGDGFHIPSNLLRLAIAPLLVWNPLTTFAGYAMAGLLVALLHWIVPGAAAARPDAQPYTTPPVAAVEDDCAPAPLAEAA